MSEAEIRPSSKIKELLDGIKIKMEQTKAAYDLACEEYAAALAILKWGKDKGKVVKTPGKRGLRKALGKGTEVATSTTFTSEPLQGGDGFWRNPGSNVGYKTRDAALTARG